MRHIVITSSAPGLGKSLLARHLADDAAGLLQIIEVSGLEESLQAPIEFMVAQQQYEKSLSVLPTVHSMPARRLIIEFKTEAPGAAVTSLFNAQGLGKLAGNKWGAVVGGDGHAFDETRSVHYIHLLTESEEDQRAAVRSICVSRYRRAPELVTEEMQEKAGDIPNVTFVVARHEFRDVAEYARGDLSCAVDAFVRPPRLKIIEDALEAGLIRGHVAPYSLPENRILEMVGASQQNLMDSPRLRYEGVRTIRSFDLPYFQAATQLSALIEHIKYIEAITASIDEKYETSSLPYLNDAAETHGVDEQSQAVGKDEPQLTA